MKIYQIREETNYEFSDYSSFCFLIETPDTTTQWFFKNANYGDCREWIISEYYPHCIDMIYDKD